MHESELAEIRAWQQADEQAVHALFNQYYPRTVRLAVLSGLTLDEAQDCAQEAFLRAFERRKQLRDNVSSHGLRNPPVVVIKGNWSFTFTIPFHNDYSSSIAS